MSNNTKKETVSIISRLQQVAVVACKILFLFCIAFVFFQVSFNNTYYEYNKLILLVIIVAGLFLLGLAYWLIKPRKSVLERYFPFILGGYLLIMFLLEIVFGLRLRFNPAFDMGSVYHGAVAWLETGAIEEFRDYFYWFPNNLGLLTVLKGCFSLGKMFGITDYFLIGTLLGAMSLIIMMFSISMICRKLLGVEYGILAMILTAFCFPLYFSAAAFYTDVMSMAAPPLFFLLYLYSREASSWRKRIAFYVGMALVAGIGMEIKFTVLIIVIAVGIEMLLKERIQYFLVMVLTQVLVIAAVFTMVNHIVYPALLDKEQARIQNTPLYHWIMMGAQGEGRYNPADYDFTRSFTDPEERDKALKEEIKRRYSQMNLSEFLGLMKRKTVNALGDGTYGISDFLDDGYVNETWLHDYILYNSPKYGSYCTLCQGVFLLIFLLMLVGGVGNLLPQSAKGKWNKQELASGTIIPSLAFLGLWMFLMLWETTARYFSNYIAILLLCAVWGMKTLADHLGKE